MGWKPEEVWFAFCHHGLLGTVRVPAAESQPALQNLAYLAEWPWCAPLKQGWNESLSTRTGNKAGRWAEIATSCTFKFRICLWPLQQNFYADTLKMCASPADLLKILYGCVNTRDIFATTEAVSLQRVDSWDWWERMILICSVSTSEKGTEMAIANLDAIQT